MLHLHNNYSFTESLVETVIRSLRHSCRSELTRQGTSLSACYSDLFGQGPVVSAGLCMSPCSSDCIFTPRRSAWRTVSEDSTTRHGVMAFPADYLHPALCHCRTGMVRRVARDTQTFQHTARFHQG